MLVIDHNGRLSSHLNKTPNISDAALLNRLTQVATTPGSGYEMQQHYPAFASSALLERRHQSAKTAVKVSEKSALYHFFVGALRVRQLIAMLFLVLAVALAEEMICKFKTYPLLCFANKFTGIFLPFWINAELDDTRLLWTHLCFTTISGIAMLICGWYDAATLPICYFKMLIFATRYYWQRIVPITADEMHENLASTITRLVARYLLIVPDIDRL